MASKIKKKKIGVKFKKKSLNCVKKRIKVTNGNDPFTGKLRTDSCGDNHYLIKHSSTTNNRGKRGNKLSKVHDKFRAVM